jgi:transglutaminase-like putative cysteine protease
MGFFRRTFGFLAHVDRLALTALAVVAVAPFSTLFASQVFLWYAIGAAVLALVVAAVCSRWPFLLTLLIAVAALAVYLCFVVFHIGVPLLSDFGDVWTGVTNSWHEMLGTSLPAVSTPTLLTLPVVMAWAAAFIGVELAARTRLVALVALPALAVFLLGLLLTGQRPNESVWAPLVLLGGALAVVLIRANAAEPATRAGSDVTVRATMAAGAPQPRVPNYLRVGIPLLIAVTAIGVLVGVGLPFVNHDNRVDIREQYRPPDVKFDGVTPLERLSAELNDPANPLMFNIKVTEPADTKVDRVRIATLDKFDGAVWNSSASFTKVGEELPTGPPQPAKTTSVSENVTLGPGYRADLQGTTPDGGVADGAFLPELDRPSSIAGDNLLFDRQTGLVVVQPGPDAGYRYAITSAVPVVPPDATLDSAPTGNDPSVSADAQLPTDTAVPQEILDYANQPDFNKPSAYESLKAMEADLKSNHFGYNAQSVPGHSYAVLQRLLAVPPDNNPSTNRTGDAEQYASAFAVLARVKGLPSRVVVGYRLDPAKVSAGTEIPVMSHDIHAWAEVNLRGIGWVPFDPTNVSNSMTPTPPPTTVPSPDNKTQNSNPQAATKVPKSTGTPSCDVVANPNCGTDETILIWWPFLLLGLVVLLPIGIVVAKRLRRRRRRRHGPPAQRVVGAWRETADRFSTLGMPASRAMTPMELVESYGPVAGDGPAQRVAEFGPVLDHTLYDEEEPSEHLVDSAWDAEAGVADALKETTSRMQRIRASIDPRPLLRRK